MITYDTTKIGKELVYASRLYKPYHYLTLNISYLTLNNTKDLDTTNSFYLFFVASMKNKKIFNKNIHHDKDHDWNHEGHEAYY